MILNIYHPGQVKNPSIHPSNGLFFNTMSRFFWVIQSSNRVFLTYIRLRPSECHPTIQQPVLEHYVQIFLDHPTIQRSIFNNMSRFFWGYPTIQQGFLHTYHTGPVCHPSIQPSNGLFFNTMSRLFWGHPIIQQGFLNIYQTSTF